MRPETSSVMAALSVRRTTWCCVWILVFLQLIIIQMYTSLWHFAGVFILSNETLISPFHFCPTRQHGELSCDQEYMSPVNRAESGIKINILTPAVILSLYVPLVLVAFALLTMLLAAYAKDRAALRLSMACQAASSLLTLLGIIVFLQLYWTYVSWKHMTPWFYICMGVQVQLVIVTALTRATGRLTSDWEWMGPNEKSSSPC